MTKRIKIILAICVLLVVAIFAFAAGPHATFNLIDLTTGFTLGGGSTISSTTGSGSVMVLANSPTIVSPTISGLTLTGVTSVTSLSVGGGTALTTSNQSGTGSLVLATSPAIASATLSGPTFTGTAAGSVFTASTSLAIAGGTALTTTNQTGTGSLALNISPTITTPNLASPTLTGNSTAALTKVTPQALAVTGANYTTSATTLAAAGVITGLNFTGPVSLLSKWSFHCNIVYSQATAAASNLWGVISAGTAPTSLGMGAEVLTNQTGAMNASAVNGITGATATTIVTSTPSAFGPIGTTADMFTAHFWGTLEAPSNATPSQVGIAVATGNASDAVTVYQDLSSCWWF